MKQTLLIAALLLGTCLATARPVDSQTAARVAKRYFAEVVNITPSHWTEAYVFEPLKGKGFVVVSADDCARPVLAYSMTDSFNPDSIPPHVAAWFDGYRAEIASLRMAGATPSPKVQQEWSTGAVSTISQGVDALLTTRWSQSPRYNWECPYSAEDSAYTVTGCVATAQAQIMKYWNHPVKGHGSHGYTHKSLGKLFVKFDTAYLWDDMPDALNWSSNEEEIHAVAQLMHHVGVAVEMDYGVNSSGAYTHAYGSYNLPSTERSLREHFRYNPMLHAEFKDNYTDEKWDSLLRNEIGHGRPVMYSGSDNEAGHAFVLDGYDTVGMFHVNWGWGGWYDGFYTTDSLSPGGGGVGSNPTNTFNKNNAAIIYIFPAYGNDTVAVVDAVSYDTTMGYIEGNGTYNAYSDTLNLMAVAKEGYRFDGWTSGLVTNPMRYVPNGDFSDTALFVPLNKDTLGYCDEVILNGWRDSYGSITEWGIRIPASQRNDTRSLSAVQLYVTVEGYYTMSIYIGDSISVDNRVYYNQEDLTEADGWTTIELPEAIPVVGNQTVWITFRFSSNESYPAALSYYTGVPDGTWYKTFNGWERMTDLDTYLTWMIRALFSERDYIVEVHADEYLDDSELSGAGEYAPGETCTLSSTYAGKPPFVGWKFCDGTLVEQDPYSFVVTQDTVVTAIGMCIGIDEVDQQPLSAMLVGNTLSLSGAHADEASLYTVDGRLVGRGRRYEHLLPGSYIVAAPGMTGKKIVVF